jgi:hypothetical protein
MRWTQDMRVCVCGVSLVGEDPASQAFQDDAQVFIIV